MGLFAHMRQSKELSQADLDRINAAAQKGVRPFVLANAELSESEFEVAVQEKMKTHVNKLTATAGRPLTDIDQLIFQATEQAMWDLYRRMRASGSSHLPKCKN